jgi:predicted metalloprotease with PDZ domain
VAGQVVEYESGQPLAGVKVTLRQAGPARETTTDAAGAFALENVPALPALAVSFETEPRTHISEYLPVPPARDGRAQMPTLKMLKFDPANPKKGRMGVSYTERDGKITIHDVDADSPAARAGLRAGDLVLEVNGSKLLGADISVLQAAMRADPGKEITVVVQSAGQPPRTIKLKRAM